MIASMTKLSSVSGLHEQSVIDAEQHAETYARPTRRSRRRPRSSAVSIIHVDERVLRTALRLAAGDASRLTLVSSTEIIVR